MQQGAKFIRKLPIPMDIKKEFPVSERVSAVREARVGEMKAILVGQDPALTHIFASRAVQPEDRLRA